jgi:hypothetical protein
MINGSVVTVFSPNFTDGVWTQFSAQWNSGNTTDAVIQIADTTAIAFGDDFALDDLSFGPGGAPGSRTEQFRAAWNCTGLFEPSALATTSAPS